MIHSMRWQFTYVIRCPAKPTIANFHGVPGWLRFRRVLTHPTTNMKLSRVDVALISGAPPVGEVPNARRNRPKRSEFRLPNSLTNTVGCEGMAKQTLREQGRRVMAESAKLIALSNKLLSQVQRVKVVASASRSKSKVRKPEK